MRFWDSSAILPLLVTEQASEVVSELLREDGEIVVWWGTWVERAVALNRLARERRIVGKDEEGARALLELLVENWSEVQPTDEMRLLAEHLSERHSLKTADALQLAAAYRWCEGETQGRGFVCLDDRLRAVAHEEGFRILPERSVAEIEAG